MRTPHACHGALITSGAVQTPAPIQKALQLRNAQVDDPSLLMT